MNKVLVVCPGNWDRSYYEPFESFGEYTNDVSLLKNEETRKEVVLVIFTGGEDVSPELYKEKPNAYTQANARRDKYEITVWDIVRGYNKPIIGICRGAQLICALTGGKLVQHITGHSRYHNVQTDDGRSIWVSSCHHQMQLPPPEAVPIAWAEPKLSSCYLGGDRKEYKPEREHDVVWYPNAGALGLQYHPEFMGKLSQGFKYAQELAIRFFKLAPEVSKKIIEPLDFTD